MSPHESIYEFSATARKGFRDLQEQEDKKSMNWCWIYHKQFGCRDQKTVCLNTLRLNGFSNPFLALLAIINSIYKRNSAVRVTVHIGNMWNSPRGLPWQNIQVRWGTRSAWIGDSVQTAYSIYTQQYFLDSFPLHDQIQQSSHFAYKYSSFSTKNI